jgi:hypothetical protein
MVYSSTSSGPILSMLAGILALFLWNYREKTRLIIWMGVIGYIGLTLVMNDPAYFIMARIDITGGSTGWHRARLIQSALEHFFEWWIAGTDYTRHWMPTGVSWSPDHTDITNHYIQMGVWGGLPLMMLFIAIILRAFSLIGKNVSISSKVSLKSEFVFWALGASLFAHAVTFLGVSYFDQSFLFLYLVLAAIASASFSKEIP